MAVPGVGVVPTVPVVAGRAEAVAPEALVPDGTSGAAAMTAVATVETTGTVGMIAVDAPVLGPSAGESAVRAMTTPAAAHGWSPRRGASRSRPSRRT